MNLKEQEPKPKKIEIIEIDKKYEEYLEKAKNSEYWEMILPGLNVTVEYMIYMCIKYGEYNILDVIKETPKYWYERFEREEKEKQEKEEKQKKLQKENIK